MFSKDPPKDVLLAAYRKLPLFHPVLLFHNSLADPPIRLNQCPTCMIVWPGNIVYQDGIDLCFDYSAHFEFPVDTLTRILGLSGDFSYQLATVLELPTTNHEQRCS